MTSKKSSLYKIKGLNRLKVDYTFDFQLFSTGVDGPTRANKFVLDVFPSVSYELIL